MVLLPVVTLEYNWNVIIIIIKIIMYYLPYPNCLVEGGGMLSTWRDIEVYL